MFEQCAEARGSGGLATLFGAPVGNRRGRKVSSCGEQAAEVECPAGVPTAVGTAVSRLSACQVAPSLEEQTKLGGGCRLSILVGTTQSRLRIIGRSLILAADTGRARVVGVRALLSWTIASFIPHAGWQFYRLEFDACSRTVPQAVMRS